MERSYSNFYGQPSTVNPGLPPPGSRVMTPRAQRRTNIPKSPHVSRVNSIRKDPVPVGGVVLPPGYNSTAVTSSKVNSATLPRSPKSNAQQRQQQLEAMHAENEKLCDSVQETYMVR